VIIEYKGKTPKIASTAFVAPTAVLIGDVEVGEESSIWFGAVLRADNGPIRIGNRSSVQDNSVLHVSEHCATIVGDDCTIGHAVVLEDCTIGNGALVGSNAVVLNGATVGEKSLVAAGSVVAANAVVPPLVVVAGAPAKVKKPLEGAAVGWVEGAPAEYVHLSRSYLHHGIGDPDLHEVIETAKMSTT
jgi:carbonic anhydrase/acetyltransferase-like protein (isoleucine patch superfamily)